MIIKTALYATNAQKYWSELTHYSYVRAMLVRMKLLKTKKNFINISMCLVSLELEKYLK